MFALGFLCTLLLHNPSEAKAETEGIYIFSGVDLKKEPDINLLHLDRIPTGFRTLFDEDNWFYFCLDQTKTYPNSSTPPYIPARNAENQGIKWLIKNFHGAKEGIVNENILTQYAMTQLAIWTHTNPTHTNYRDKLISDNQHLKHLIDESRKHKDDIDVEAELMQTELELTSTKFVQDHADELFKSTITAKITHTEALPTDKKINMNDIKVYSVENGQKKDITNNSHVHLTENNFKIDLAIDELLYLNFAPYSTVIVEWDGQVAVTDNFVQGYKTATESIFQPVATAHIFELTHDIKDDTSLKVDNFINISGKKKWDDGNNQDGNRPESITVNLLTNGVKTDSKEVSAKTNWAYTFDRLHKYDIHGELFTYTVEEVTVPGYETSQNGFDFTNSYKPLTTERTVSKKWDDSNDKAKERPEVVYVQLYADAKTYGKKVKLNEENKWTYTWKDLPKNNAGHKIKYTIKETTKVPHYKNSVEIDADGNFLLTNTYVPPTTPPPGEETPPPGEETPPPGEGTPPPGEENPPSGEAGDDEPGNDSENPLAGENGTNKPSNTKPGQSGKPSVDQDQAQNGKLPQTGEQAYIAYIILGAVFILGAILVIKRRRKIINYIDLD